MSSNALINKYRPKTFSEVMGNTLAITNLIERVESASCPHSFLLSGPSGIGKTTLARIIATAKSAQVDELDAATNRGIDAIRLVIQTAGFQPLFADKKMIIIDEAHGLTKDAWDSLLKLLEEPPEYLYIGLCTTVLDKIPETIRTRCHHVVLRSLKSTEISDYVETISFLEGWKLEDSVFNGIVQAATGQPRKALAILQAGHTCQSMIELGEVVAEVEQEDTAIFDLNKFLIGGGKDWDKVRKFLSAIDDDDQAWSSAVRQLTNTIVGAEQDKAKNVHRLLAALLFPRAGYDKKALLVAGICDFLWN